MLSRSHVSLSSTWKHSKNVAVAAGTRSLNATEQGHWEPIVHSDQILVDRRADRKRWSVSLGIELTTFTRYQTQA